MIGPTRLGAGNDDTPEKGLPVKLIVCRGATHGFNAPAPARGYLGHHREYDAKATAEAWARVRSFLHENLSPSETADHAVGRWRSSRARRAASGGLCQAASRVGGQSRPQSAPWAVDTQGDSRKIYKIRGGRGDGIGCGRVDVFGRARGFIGGVRCAHTAISPV